MKGFWEPDLDRFRERYDAGELSSAGACLSDEAPTLSLVEYRKLTTEQKAERLRAQQRAYGRRKYRERLKKGWKS